MLWEPVVIPLPGLVLPPLGERSTGRDGENEEIMGKRFPKGKTRTQLIWLERRDTRGSWNLNNWKGKQVWCYIKVPVLLVSIHLLFPGNDFLSSLCHLQYSHAVFSVFWLGFSKACQGVKNLRNSIIPDSIHKEQN